MKEVQVKVPGHSYTIKLGSGVIKELPAETTQPFQLSHRHQYYGWFALSKKGYRSLQWDVPHGIGRPA